MRPHRTHRGERREEFRPHQRLGGLLQPILGEDGLDVVHDRALDPHAGVAPVFLVLAVAGPLLGDAVAEHVGHLAVENGELAVGPVIEQPDVLDLEGVEPRDPDACLLHQLEELVVPVLRADGVQGEPDLHSLAGTGSQRFGQAPADVPLPPDVGLDVDRLPGRRDVAEEGGEELVAVLQDLDAVAREDGRAGQPRDRREHGLEAAEVRDLDVGLPLPPRRPEQERQAEEDGHVEGHGAARDLDRASLFAGLRRPRLLRGPAHSSDCHVTSPPEAPASGPASDAARLMPCLAGARRGPANGPTGQSRWRATRGLSSPDRRRRNRSARA